MNAEDLAQQVVLLEDKVTELEQQLDLITRALAAALKYANTGDERDLDF